MKTSTILSVSLLAAGFALWSGAALADSTAANCDVGGISQTTEDCTDQQIERSREVGQRGY